MDPLAAKTGFWFDIEYNYNGNMIMLQIVYQSPYAVEYKPYRCTHLLRSGGIRRTDFDHFTLTHETEEHILNAFAKFVNLTKPRVLQTVCSREHTKYLVGMMSKCGITLNIDSIEDETWPSELKSV